MNSRSNDGSIPQARLDSWESIGNYLGRSARTVQRWHGLYGLPVQHLGGKRGAVFAFADKLDDWMRHRGGDGQDEPAEGGKPMLLPAPVPPLGLVRRNFSFDPSMVSSADATHAVELVAHAQRMWEILSYSNLKGIARHFREAVDLDPGNAEAFAGLAHSLIAEGLWDLLNAPEAYDAAEVAIRKALEIDPSQLEAKCARAWHDMLARREWQAAHSGFELVLRHCPRSTRAMAGMALYHVAQGTLEQASAYMRQAARLNTLSASPAAMYCWQTYLSGRFADALDECDLVRASGRFGPIVFAAEALASIHFEEPETSLRRIETLVMDSPQFDVLKGALAYAYALNGLEQKAENILDSMTLKGASARGCDPYAIALILIGLNRNREAVDWLEKSYREGSLWSLGYKSDPVLDPLRNDPNFLRLMSKISYPLPESTGARLRIVG